MDRRKEIEAVETESKSPERKREASLAKTAGGPILDKPLHIASLVAAPFSGATLFSFFLNGHQSLVCNGEAFPVACSGGRTTCSCGTNQVQCDFYRKTASHMMTVGGADFNDELFAFVPRYVNSYYLNRALSGYWLNHVMSRLQHAACRVIPTLRDKEMTFVEAQERFLRNSQLISNAELVVDGTKSFRRAELFAQSGRFQQKLIHLIRDGRSFCCSYLKNYALPRTRLKEAASFWVKAVRKVDVFAKRYKRIPVLHVRYEDFCRNTRATLEAVSRFLGVPCDPNAEDNVLAEHHIVGHGMRFRFDGNIRESRPWESELTEAELSRITAIMRDPLERFGYLSPGPGRCAGAERGRV